MKKYLSLLAVFIATIISGSFLVSADDLTDISLSYCDTTGNILNYTLDPGTTKDICYTLNNNSAKDLIIKVNFIDGTYTNDQRQNRACLSEDAKENFGQYVTQYSNEVTLTSWESRQEIAKLSYPKWTDGQYHGCVTYTVTQATKDASASSNFAILIRKAKFIDVMVGKLTQNIWGWLIFVDFTPTEWTNLSTNQKIRVYVDPSDNSYTIQLHIKNIWNAEENFAITGVVSNALTYKRTFTEQRKILKGEEFIIAWKLNEIPLYDFTVDVQLAHTPNKETLFIHEKTHIFIFNIITYITLIGLLLLIIILIFLFKRKKKEVYYVQVQQAPIQQAPVQETPQAPVS